MIDILCILDTLAGYARHGRLHRFTFRGATGLQVERILRDYGVPKYGRRVLSNGDRTFLVSRKQAVFAEWLLVRGGVPLTCRLLRQDHKAGPMPPTWKDTHGRTVGIRHPSIVARIAKLMGV